MERAGICQHGGHGGGQCWAPISTLSLRRSTGGIVATIPPGAFGLSVNQRCSVDWCFVRYRSHSGYANRAYIKPISGRSPQKYRVVNVANNDRLNLRQAPSPRVKVLSRIRPNAVNVLIVGECKNSWCPVDHDRVQGWVHRHYLKPAK